MIKPLKNHPKVAVQVNLLLRELSFEQNSYNYVFVISIKNPSPRFNILKYVEFLTGSTRSAGSKLFHKTASTNSTVNSYFYRLPKLRNQLPIIDLSRSLHEIKLKLKKYFWNHFIANFDSNIPCTFPCTHCCKSPTTCN